MGKKAGEKRMYTRVHVVEQNICPSRKICFLLLLCRTATTTVNDKHEAYYEWKKPHWLFFFFIHRMLVYT